MTAKRPQSASSLDALLDVAAEAMEVSRAQVAPEGTGPLRAVAIDAIRPDPLQARRVLPPAVRAGFVTGQLDPPGALAAWRALAEDDPAEAELLQSQIVSLATSIRQQELVNPITVYPDGQGGYVLETGERRWWAHWWLVAVQQEPAFATIRAQVVAQPSPERQAAENLQDSALTAVQEACQVARLLLHLTGRDTDHVVAISADDGDGHDAWVGYEPFRAALELERGKVYGKWPVIAQVMGRGERQLLRQLAILKLADGALAIADRGGLTEGQLRPLVSVAATTPPERQRRIVTLIARYDLPGADVTRLVKAANLDDAEARIRRQRGLDRDDAPVAPTAIRRPSSILVERLRKVRRLAARHEKGGLRVADVVEEIVDSGQAGAIYRDLDELTAMLVVLRDELSRRINPSG